MPTKRGAPHERITAKVTPAAELNRLYAPPAGEVVIVDVPELRFAMVDGSGDPNTAPAYREALEALYGVSYALMFLLKRDQGADVRVMPLEGLWWAADMAEFSVERKGEWLWTAMIAQPAAATPDAFDRAVEQLRAKKAPPALSRLRFEAFREGLAAQTLPIGPYAAEGPTIERLHAFIRDRGYVLAGKHHEIYRGDPRRTSPERLRTILRQPVRPGRGASRGVTRSCRQGVET